GGSLDANAQARRLELPEVVKVVARDVRGRVRAARRAKRAASAVRDFDPDVCIARRLSYDYTLPVILAATACPVVAECNAVASLESKEYRNQRTLPSERTREIEYLRGADLCVAITDELAAQLFQLGVDSDHIEVVSNGVDTKLFSSVGPKDEAVLAWAMGFDVVLGYCASVGPIHDLSTVATALREIAERAPRVGFLFVGPRDSDLLDAGLPERLVADRCLAVGRVPHGAVPAFLRCADVYWAALNNEHGSPLKVFEFFALGGPVIIAAHGSGVQPVFEARAGAVVPKGDASALASAVLARIVDRGLRESEGLSAARWVTENATWEAVAVRIVDAVGRRTVARTEDGARWIH
ncbi:MAG: glycosyltransferase, partial [Candidatus Nanopelagicales bacterium]